MPGVNTNTGLAYQKQAVKLNLFQKTFDFIFKPCTKGRLTVHFPKGGVLVYGNGEGGAHAVIIVRDNNFFKRCILFGDVGFGESFVAGEWNSPDLTKVIEWMIINVENHPTLIDNKKKVLPVNLFKAANNVISWFRQNTPQGSRNNIESHYDLGNDFYRLILDPTMTYSCAYFKTGAEDLNQAQLQKYEALCLKLRLKRADHVLEIGSGWGGFAIFAAKNFGCRVTTVTISKEQYEYARKRINDEGLDGQIKILYQDYRELTGAYDKIISIEMIEAVGHKFYKTYFVKIHELLKKDGLLALQMIISPDHRYDTFRKNIDFIQKHIFPGSLLPSMAVIQKTLNQTGDLNLFDYEDITLDYANTLQFWRANYFDNISQIRSQGFSDEFIRKWHYYWCYCEAAFSTRNIAVVHAVYSRPNNLKL